ncbi:MAG TPA: hypothetical protein VGH43_14775, partial [Jatrophihabitans sp.]
MNDDELERLLGEAFDAKARAAVPEEAPTPPMRQDDQPLHHRHRAEPRRSHWLAPAAAAAAVLLIVGTIFAISQFTSANDQRVQVGLPGSSTSTLGIPSSHKSPSTSGAPSRTKPTKPAKPVHVSLKFGDGQTLGVGMPIIAYLSRPITDARGFAAATKVTV